MNEAAPGAASPSVARPGSGGITFAEATRVWMRVGLHSFGGPAGQIAVMHRILVEEKAWVSEQRFLHALNYCMLLPGPEAQQLATYLGWLLHGTRGGLVAGTLFVAPGFVSILLLSILYTRFQGLPLTAALFFGLKAAVLAVILEAVLRIGRRVLKNSTMVLFAALAFVSMFFFHAPFPLVIVAAGLGGAVGGLLQPARFAVLLPRETGDGDAVDRIPDRREDARLRSWKRALKVCSVALVLWWGPIAVLAALLGANHVFTQEGLFFSKAAVITFGGAYAVLAYLAQQAVQHYGWLSPGAMLDGLGLAETTPGPLIMVTQFVGFLGAAANPGALHPLVAGTLGACLTTWVTFVPCFLWIFLGAPYVESLRHHRGFSAALSAITAAVVGVILNLACWFGLHVLFATVEPRSLGAGIRMLVPQWGTFQAVALGIAAASFVALVRFKVGLFPVLGSGVVLGVVACWLGLGR